MSMLNLRDDDPPVYLMIIPPFSLTWVEQMEGIGAVPATSALKQRLGEVGKDVGRKQGWEIAAEMEQKAKDSGAAGVVLMGLKFESIVDEAIRAWPELE
jgi:5,10-methylenetetrahydrofolate reductase